MTKIIQRAPLWFGIPILGLLACQSTAPPELENARTAYARASTGAAANLVPADVHVAHEALMAAEQSFHDDGASDATKDLAYAAERRAEIAEVRARGVAAEQLKSQDVSAAEAAKDQQVRTTSAELSTTRQTLAAAGQALVNEKQAREDAERRATQAANDLARIASVKQEPRGMVITLSGSVLFASGKADLLPAAQAKLSQVADVLSKQDKDSKIRVEGHTDSQGPATFNQDLSQRRAEAVRSYLTSHGIAPDRIVAEGYGPTRPVADNQSPEGRADNRRVEIVVEPTSQTAQ